jgi:hypothetical protein
LASLAKDYLACIASSASVERCFSAAADICGQGKGGLASRTIERCVSLHQWLQQGIEPDGNFEQAQRVISLASEEIQEIKNLRAPEDPEKVKKD